MSQPKQQKRKTAQVTPPKTIILSFEMSADDALRTVKKILKIKK